MFGDPSYYADSNTGSNHATLQWLEQTAKEHIGGIGTMVSSVMQAAFMDPVLIGLPMGQALLLLAVYALLPLVIVVARYSFSILMIAGIGIFVIKFLSVLWHLSAWVDNNLIYSLYPNADAWSFGCTRSMDRVSGGYWI